MPGSTTSTMKSLLNTASIFISTFFITVATILGTGILALPVKLSESGFWPFLFTFTLCLIAQSVVAILMVELLQKAYVLSQKSDMIRLEDMVGEAFMTDNTETDSENMSFGEANSLENQSVPGDLSEPELEDVQLETEASLTDAELPNIGAEEKIGDSLMMGSFSPDEQSKAPQHHHMDATPATATTSGNKLLSTGPDLHTMSGLFLPRILQIGFEISVMGHFISILTSYGLAGPKAFAQLFGISDIFQVIIPFFVIGLALLVIFGSRLIQIFISIVTLFKGTLLVVMIFIVGIVGLYVNQEPTDHWQFVGRPFLISTVALGGTCNTIPLVFSSMTRNGPPSKLNVHIFRLGAVLGIIACFILNVLWCVFILRIVPQTGDISLTKAEEEGNISTAPLVRIIESTPKLHRFKWIGVLVEIFIATSITVSFVTLSSGMKHVLDGYVKSFKSAARSKAQTSVTRVLRGIMRTLAKCTRHPATVIQFSLYSILYGVILLLALLNPKSFFIVMEVFASMALNLESGFFISIMIFVAARYKVDIPVKLPRWMNILAGLVAAYFLFAVVYDVFYTLLRMGYYVAYNGSDDYIVPI